MTPSSPEAENELDEKRVCKNGHSGNFRTTSTGEIRCRQCERAAWARYNELHRDRRRASDQRRNKERLQDPKYRSKQLEWNKDYRHNNPVKTTARRLVQTAVKRGKLIKPILCQSCNELKPIEGHHYDYDRAYDVLWLCKKCHEALHHTTVGELV